MDERARAQDEDSRFMRIDNREVVKPSRHPRTQLPAWERLARGTVERPHHAPMAPLARSPSAGQFRRVTSFHAWLQLRRGRIEEGAPRLPQPDRTIADEKGTALAHGAKDRCTS